MENFYNKVDDRAMGAAGGQQITTADGHNFALSIVNGLPYIKMKPYAEEQYNSLPHVIMTSEKEWDPRIFDNMIDPTDPGYNAVKRPNRKLLPHDDYNVKGDNFARAKSEKRNCSSLRDAGNC